jgi:plastocyanin
MKNRLALIMIFALGCSNGKKNDAKHLSHTIQIAQMRFIPSQIEVEVNDTIVFISKDIVPHDITEASEKKWSSSVLNNGSSWTLIVQDSADFYCSIHPMMKGSIKIKL